MHRRGRQKGKIRVYCADYKKKQTINEKHSKKAELLKEHLNRKSYRTLEDDYGISAKTICSFTNTVTTQLIHSNELTKFLEQRSYSGIMLVDGKYVPVKYPNKEKIKGLVPRSAKRKGKTKKGLVILPFMDYKTHDIPVYIIVVSENQFEIREGFRQLKEMGYPLRVLICDESMAEIAKITEEFYPDVIIQTCLKHYSANVDKEFKVKRTMKAIERKLEKIGDSIFIPTHHHDIEKARNLTNQLANLEFEYGYLIEGFNSTTLELRFSSIRGFECEKTALSYINAMILKYRFHKFKCCKKQFKKLNGKSPLEISNPLHNSKNLCSKDWVELCRKLKS